MSRLLEISLKVAREKVEAIGWSFDSTDDDWWAHLIRVDKLGAEVYSLDEYFTLLGKDATLRVVVPSIVYKAWAAIYISGVSVVTGEDLEDEPGSRPSTHSHRVDAVACCGVENDGSQEFWLMEVVYDEQAIRRPGVWRQMTAVGGEIAEALAAIREEWV